MENLDYYKSVIGRSRNKYHAKIKAEKTNFLFLSDGTMIYDYYKFDSYLDALIDAIKQGEDIDEMIALVFPEKVDHPIMKKKLEKMLNE